VLTILYYVLNVIVGWKIKLEIVFKVFWETLYYWHNLDVNSNRWTPRNNCLLFWKTSAYTTSFCEKVSGRFLPSTNIEDWSELKGILLLSSNSHFDSPNARDINYLTALTSFGISNLLDESLAGVLSNTNDIWASKAKIILMYEYIWLTIQIPYIAALQSQHGMMCYVLSYYPFSTDVLSFQLLLFGVNNSWKH
jgi:hypothetical protein